MKFLLSFNNIKALTLSILVCFDVLSSECFDLIVTRKVPMLAPLEGLHAPGVPGVNPRGRPQESGDDSMAI